MTEQGRRRRPHGFVRLPWTVDPRREGHLDSAAAVAELATSGQVTSEMRAYLLRVVEWYVSEAGGKLATRYRSAAAWASQLEKRDSDQLRHDHVYTRRSLGKQMIAIGPDRAALRDLLATRALGCVVLRTEHDGPLHTKFLGDVDGWDRYRQAKIDVVDRKLGCFVIRDGVDVNGGPLDGAEN